MTGNFPVTSVHAETDTIYTRGTFDVIITNANGHVGLIYEGAARISTLLENNQDKNYRVEVGLNNASFATKSPKAVSMPVINVVAGVANQVFLPSVAFDNARIEWSFSTPAQSSLVTAIPTGMTLSPDAPGLINFTPGTLAGPYAVQFRVAAFNDQNQKIAEVPLDMIFLSQPATTTTATIQTSDGGETYFAPISQPFSLTLQSALQNPQPGGYSGKILYTSLPTVPTVGNLGAAAVSQTSCAVNNCQATFTWTPSLASSGSVVCFQAVYTPTNGILPIVQSPQRCLTLNLGALQTTMQAFPASGVAGGGPMVLRARLTRTIDGAPLPARTVVFSDPAGGQFWQGGNTAVTDATGEARLTVLAVQPTPGRTYQAAFSSVVNELLFSSATSTVTVVTGASATLDAPILNPLASMGVPVTAQVRLNRVFTDGGTVATAGEVVQFTMSDPGGQQFTANGVTDTSGIAHVTFANPLSVPGLYTLRAYFAGSTTLAGNVFSPTINFTPQQRVQLLLNVPATAAVAQSVTLTGSLLRYPQGTPLVSRTIALSGGGLSTTATTNAAGNFSLSASFPTAGNHTITGSYTLGAGELNSAGLLAAEIATSPLAVFAGMQTEIVVSPVTAISGQQTVTTARLQAAATDAPISLATLTFSIPGVGVLGTAQTDASGVASLTWMPGAATTGQLQVSFAGIPSGPNAAAPASASAALTIVAATTSLSSMVIAPTAFVGDTVTATTTLARTSAPAGVLPGLTVTFTATRGDGSTAQFTATTSSLGVATVNVPLTVRGVTQIAAAFAGSSTLAGASQSSSVTVYQKSNLVLNGASGAAGAATQLTAALTALPGGLPLAGQAIAFSCASGAITGTASTDAQGLATVALTFQNAGSFQCTASFSNLAGHFADSTGALIPETSSATMSITTAVSQLQPITVDPVQFVGGAMTASTTLNRVTAPAGPIANAAVTCTLTGPGGAVSTTGTTDATGIVSCGFTPNAKGVHTLSASFAGSGGIQPATTSTTVTVYQRVNLVLSPATGTAGATVPVTATLTTEPGNTPLANQRVDFSFAGGPASQFTITDGNGEATVIVQFPNAGNFTADASFANVAGFFANEAGALAAETATASIAITMAATTLSQPILTPTSASTALVGNSLGVSTALSRTSAPAGPLSGALVSFTVTGSGGFTSTLTATTDATGFASVVFPLTQRGQFHIEVAYAGSNALAPTSRTADFSVYQRTALILNPIFGPARTDTSITALLTSIPGDAPIAAQQVAISCPGTPTNSTGTTDASGQATIFGNFANAGSYPCSATFSNLADHFVDENGQPLPTTAIASAEISQVSVSLSPLTVAPTQFTGTTLALTTVLSRVTAPSGVIAGQQVTFTIAGPGGVMSTLAATTDTNGIASAALPLTIRGPYNVTATFAGDSALSPGSTSAPFTVYQRAAIDIAPVSGAAGTPITITATLTGTPEGAPLANQAVQFSFGGAAADQTVQTNAAGIASVTVTFANAGNVTATASFANVADYFANRNGQLAAETDSATVTVTAAATTLTALTAPATAIAGTTVSVSARLSRVDGTTIPAGRPVDFTVTHDGNVVQTVTGLTDATGIASASVTINDRGAHAVSAAFAAADGLLASSATPVSITVYQRVQMTVPATITAIAGSTVNITGTMTSGGSPVAGQAVSFTFSGTGAPAPQTATTDGNGVASALVTFDDAGTYAVDASFLNADGFFTNAAGALPPAPETDQGDVTVERAATTLQLQPLDAAIGLVDNSQTVRARLQRTDGVPVAAGKAVTFTFTAPGGATSSVNGTTQADGLVSVTFTPAAKGLYTYSAAFATDTALLASATMTESVTVYQRVSLAMPATITSIATQPVTISATLTTLPGGAPIANQAISFQFSGGGSLPVSQSATTNAAGVASITVTFPVLGAYTATASFENFAGHFTSPAGDAVAVPVTATSNVDVRNTPPTFTPPANITAEAAAANGATVTFVAIGTDVEDGTIPAQCTPVSGTRFPIGTTTVNCTVTDSAQVSASGAFTVTVRDTTAPALTIPAPITVPAANNNGATVTFSASAADAVSGAVTPVCTPASGSMFAIQTTTVSCTATDGAGNSVTKTFTVKVTEVTTPGEMRGNGHITEDGARYKFDFWVRETDRSGERGAFELDIDQKEECDCRDNRNRRVSHNHRDDRHHDCRGRDRDDRFKARSVDFVAFSDDPTIRPGRPRRPQVDTVLFSGVGEWNGRRNYRYEVRATDEGEPGRHREMVSITIWDPNGVVVAQVSGDIDGGNIQSSRIDHRGTNRH